MPTPSCKAVARIRGNLCPQKLRCIALSNWIEETRIGPYVSPPSCSFYILGRGNSDPAALDADVEHDASIVVCSVSLAAAQSAFTLARPTTSAEFTEIAFIGVKANQGALAPDGAGIISRAASPAREIRLSSAALAC